MFATLRNLVADLMDEGSAHAFENTDYRLAAAALLVRAAIIDGHFDDDERAKLHERLKSRFALDDAGAAALIAEAAVAEQQAVDLYGFTSLLDRALDDEGRRHLVEMMWEIVYADNRVSEFEDNLLWRVADLLHVPSRDRIELRRRVVEKSALDRGE
jgi:uncharacterized tellurite resistance protein B-like protein